MSEPPAGDGFLTAPEPSNQPGRGPRLRFPKAARLTRAGEFSRVKEQGRSFPGRLLVLGVLPDAEPSAGAGSRIGLVTSRRVGGAVVRNTVRRHLREAVRHARPRLRGGYWIVVVARYTAGRARSEELAAEWLKLARRAGILLPDVPVTPPPTPP